LNRETLHTALLWPHIALGSVALLSMWVPLLSRKGSKLHRRAGWVYVAAMAVVSLTALGMSALWLSSGLPDDRSRGLFFGFLGLLSANNNLYGLRALRLKRRAGPQLGALDVASSGGLALVGLGLLGYGAASGQWLSAGFGALGLVLGAQQLRELLRPPTDKLRCLPIPLWALWVAPTVVALVLLKTSGDKDRERFSRGAGSPPR
jgi:uncharacterized membrane protein